MTGEEGNERKDRKFECVFARNEYRCRISKEEIKILGDLKN